MPLSKKFITELCQHLELPPEKILAQPEADQLISLRIELCKLLRLPGDTPGDEKTGEKVFMALMLILQQADPPSWLKNLDGRHSVPHLLTTTVLSGYWDTYDLRISAALLLKLLNIAMREPTDKRVEGHLIPYFITDWSSPETKIQYLAALPAVDYVANYYRMLASEEDAVHFHAEHTAMTRQRIKIPYDSWYEVLFRLVETLIEQRKIKVPFIWHRLIQGDYLPSWLDARREFLFLADNYGATGYPTIAQKLRSIIITADSQETLDLIELSRELALLYREQVLPSSATPQPRMGLFTIYEPPQTPHEDIETARAKQHALTRDQQLFLELLEKYFMISYSGHLPDALPMMSTGAKTLAENLLKITLTRHAQKQDISTPITEFPLEKFLAIQAQLDILRAHLLYKNTKRNTDYDSPAERKLMTLLAIKKSLKILMKKASQN